MSQQPNSHEKTLQQRSDTPPADPAQAKPIPKERASLQQRKLSGAWWLFPLIVTIILVLILALFGNIYAS